MSIRRITIPITMILVILMQFLPGSVMGPRPAAASACDWAQFTADVTVPDGTTFAPGSPFLKTWRLKNIGTCTWTTSYSAVLSSGDQMNAPASIFFTNSVAPGDSINISANMVAPSTPGHYRGNWILRNGSGGLFGVGPAANAIFWVDIYVGSSYSSSYDFVANYASATWTSGAGGLPVPGTDGAANGFVLKVTTPQLEDGSTDPNPGLVVGPQNVSGGYIQGVYPAYTVQSGDHFMSIINCAYGATGCYVNFRLNYQIGSGPVQSFWSFNERYDGLFYRANIDLSSLAGQTVNFILYMADVSGHGTPSGDRAEWVETKIAGPGGSVPPIPPSSTCDKGAFIADVTIPDGTSITAGTPFTKTWRIRNVGSCTWTTSYALMFAFGTQMGAPAIVNLPSSVAPGDTMDFSVNLTAPSTPGHYRSYWRFRNASGVPFGVGSGNVTFFADINVTSGYPSSSTSTTTITGSTPDPSTPSQAVSVSVTVSGSGATPTGWVAIGGADSTCTITLSGGSGSCNVVFNSIGTKTLTAIYSGDANYISSSATSTHNVTTIGSPTSVTTITADTPSPSLPGQSVTVSANVAGGSSTPTGTVSISGGDGNCTITLSAGGTGSCNMVFNTSGIKTILAIYSGDIGHGSSSTTKSHTVNQGPSTTTITANTPNPVTTGQPVAVSVTVSGAGATPVGTVAITGADSNCNITLSTGTGSCNVSFSSAGSKTLTASYSGDGNYASSSSTISQTVTVPKAPSTTTITGDVPDPSTPGQSVVVGVTVSGTGTTPTGTVSITGADTNCTITLAAGSGSCNVVFNTTGSKTINAAYSGDTNYSTSTGTESHTVNPGPTTLTITADAPDPSVTGQSVAVSVTVAGSGVIPTGTVAITGADMNCTVILSGGSGSCNIVFNTVGAKTIQADYSGDMNYAVSSITEPHTVNQGPTATTIISVTPNPSAVGGTVTTKVTVTGAGATPTGGVTVTFTGSGAPAPCVISLIGGVGSCDVIFTAIGSYTITANYSGDANYLPSVSAPVGHVVN